MVHVLLVEDSPSDVLMIREAVRKSSIPVDGVFADDGEEALSYLQGSHFDLVIMDLNVPKVSGHTILERYRVQNGPAVVVFSSSEDPKDREKALALGATDYVVKPWGYEEFMGAVQGILERHAGSAAAAATTRA